MGALETVGVLVREFGPHGVSIWQNQKQEEALKRSHEIQMEHLEQIRHATVGPSPKKEGCTTCHLSRTKASVGRPTWVLLHKLPSTLPEKPDEATQESYVRYIEAIVTNFVCHECASEGGKYIQEHPIDASSRDALASWLCDFHNSVNERTNRPNHSCSR